jgi:phage tail sheath protein FI
MYYGLRHYFDNGGGPCYIISVAKYEETPEIDPDLLADGLDILIKEDEPTLILFPDAAAIATASAAVDFYGIYKKALAQCAKLKDRFTIIDVFDGDVDFQTPGGSDVINDATVGLRTLIGTTDLKYGAAYYPWLKSNYVPYYDETEVDVAGGPAGMKMMTIFNEGETIDPDVSLYHFNNGLYNSAKAEIAKNKVVMPPSSAMAGVYAKVDSTRGVWKAPANVSLNQVVEPVVAIDKSGNDDLNIHTTGKSVNAIRSFTGKGIMVWGARTLAGNDNEWKYVPVRRFFNMVEESVKKASGQYVFEPNDANTWAKVRAMIENFLLLQWRAGALQGAKPEQAFYVQVGLGTTMTALDILEGRMIVEIGMAVVRPAEFIILRFSHKMPEA